MKLLIAIMVFFIAGTFAFAAPTDLTGADEVKFKSSLGNEVALRGRLNLLAIQGYELEGATKVTFYVIGLANATPGMSKKWEALSGRHVRIAGKLQYHPAGIQKHPMDQVAPAFYYMMLLQAKVTAL